MLEAHRRGRKSQRIHLDRRRGERDGQDWLRHGGPRRRIAGRQQGRREEHQNATDTVRHAQPRGVFCKACASANHPSAKISLSRKGNDLNLGERPEKRAIRREITVSSATTVDATRGGPPDPGAGTRSYLVVREGPRTQVIHLDDGAEVTLGRAAEATVRVSDVKASRAHARFVRTGGVLRLIDLGSRNGTRLNGENVGGQTRTLGSGDLVHIGRVEILVAETAGVGSIGAGARVDTELRRLIASTGHAVLVRLSVTHAEH